MNWFKLSQIAIGLLVALAFAAPLISAQKNNTALEYASTSSVSDIYLNALNKTLPKTAQVKIVGRHDVVEQTQDMYSITEMSQAEANQLSAASIAGTFIPSYSLTTVLLVDRTRAPNIDSFRSLLESNIKVYIPESSPEFVEILAGIGYAHAKQSSVSAQHISAETIRYGTDYVERLYNENRLETAKHTQDYAKYYFDAPVAIMSDLKATQLRKSGIRSEIIVPKDGTVSFPHGIFRGNPAPFPIELLSTEQLVEAGFRPLNYVNDLPNYPPPAQYKVAVNVAESFDYFMLHNQASSFVKELLSTPFWHPKTAWSYVAAYTGLLLLIVLWGVSALWRVEDRVIGLLLATQAGLLVMWILIRLVKFFSFGQGERLLWYFYYIPMLGSVAIMYFIANRLSRKPRTYRPVSKFVLIVNELFFLVILSNDFHNLVFRLNSVNGILLDYNYGPVYYLLLIWIIVLTVIALKRLMTYRALYSKPTFITLSVATLFLTISFLAGYMNGYKPLSRTELTLVLSTAIVVIWEFLLQSKIIPTCQNYVSLFNHTTLPISLMDRNRNIQLSTPNHLSGDDSNEVLSKKLLEEIYDKAVQLTPASSCQIIVQEEKTLTINFAKANNEIAIWQQDITELEKQRRTLALANARLHTQAQIEYQRQQAATATRRLEYRNYLNEQISGYMAEQLAEIHRLSDALTTTHDQQQIVNILRNIKLDLSACKRTTLLTIQVDQSPLVGLPQLLETAQLLAQDFSYDTSTASFHCEKQGEVSANTALLTIKCLHMILSASIPQVGVSVFGVLKKRADTLVLSILHDYWEAGGADIAQELHTKLNALSQTMPQIHFIIAEEHPSLRLLIDIEDA